MALLRGCLCRSEEDFGGLLNLENLRLFSYKEIRAATNNFDQRNKLGRGGFGTVYKGVWGDGSTFAAKVLSSESEQGVKEFLAEIESISQVKHANLVRLLGCCIQRKNRILIYEYLENNSLDHALQGSGNGGTCLTWSTRSDICVGTAKGLSYLHEEHEPNIVHRDIKASNVLLDRDYRPKIGDFGLAKLFPDNVTHISTGVVGTCGYLAPEYFVHGQLTKKADVYSFGVLVLEIISGRRISQTIRSDSDMFLVREVKALSFLPTTSCLSVPANLSAILYLSRHFFFLSFIRVQAWVLYQQGRLLDMVDARMEGCYPEEEVLRHIRVGLACTQATPSSRPTMSQVVAMLSRLHEDEAAIPMRPPSFAEHYGDRTATDGPSVGPLLQVSPKARWPDAAAAVAQPPVCSASFTYSEVAPR
ncbi:hypothetical protein HU200_039318 [Digitaria exilis]|uniref:non-specific serine/threonine protein kinase n=1 Tax=Digitaria exilis TaxID=1010633 RepID=A0A835EII6_9POAL|nr:hypothetical protein HU200_039318 [Digitaria exilis]